MMMNRSIVSFFAVVLFACSGSAAEPPATTSTATEHAPSSAVPGSHDDWCDEHEVPESLCTRCNPGLIPAFQATGDWCAEHGVPESQCRICHPELVIERPARGAT
jgi:hypothetical protein